MELTTLLIGMVASALVLCVSPLRGLIVYTASLVWYPSYLAVSVGTIDFTVRRIVILALLAKLFLGTSLPKQFRLTRLDKLVIGYFIAQLLSGVLTTPIGTLLENRAGAVCDAVLPYFAVRLIIRNKQQYLALLKAILIIAVPLAATGLYQCLTGNNPVGFLMNFRAWMEPEETSAYVPLFRKGFYRASVTFAVSIMFGLFFAMVGPVCVGLVRSIRKNKSVYGIGILLTGIGVFSSMSSGALLATLMAVFFLVFYRYRMYWKTTLVIAILMCGTVEYISNRHFYDVLGDFTLNPHTAAYRSRLIQVALFEGGMSGHWLLGFGYDVDPGWKDNIDRRDHTDIVNHYLLILCRFGLIGLIPFLAMNVEVVKELLKAFKASILESERWLVWSLSAGLFGVFFAFFTVSIFDQSISVLYMLIGFAGIMPAIVTRRGHQGIAKPELSSSQVLAI